MNILDKNASICHFPDSCYWVLVQDDFIVLRRGESVDNAANTFALSKEYSLDELMDPVVDTGPARNGGYTVINDVKYNVTTRVIYKNSSLIFDDLSFITWEVTKENNGFNVYNFSKRHTGYSTNTPYSVIRQFARCIFTVLIKDKDASLLTADWVIHDHDNTVYTNIQFSNTTETSDESENNQLALIPKIRVLNKNVSSDSITFKLQIHNKFSDFSHVNTSLIIDVYDGVLHGNNRVINITNGISNEITIKGCVNPVFSLRSIDTVRCLGVFNLNAI